MANRKKAEKSPEFLPPPHLSKKSKSLWSKLVPRRARSPERLVHLTVALEALDRADGAREISDREGITIKTKTTGAVHIHPAVKVERENRQLFARIWNDLDLTWWDDLDGQTLKSGFPNKL